MTPHVFPSLTPVALCIPDDDDTEILTLLEEHSRTLKVVRRCADLVELEAAAKVGIARIGVLSGTDPDCDTHYIERLHHAGMMVILLQDYTPAGEAIGTHSLMELGADRLAPANDPTQIVRALLDLTHSLAAGGAGNNARGQEKAQDAALPPSVDTSDEESDAAGASHEGTTRSTPDNSSEELRAAPLFAAMAGFTNGADNDKTTLEAPQVTKVVGKAEAQQAAGAQGDAAMQGADGTQDLNDAGRAYSATEEEGSSLSASDRAWLNSSNRGARRGTVIAVWGTSGAPGRTTTAINLAAALQRQPGVPSLQVILIDADTYAPSVAHALGMGAHASSLSAIARYAARGELHAEHIEHTIQQSHDGMNVITGLSSPHRWREAAPSTLTQCIHAARECADYVIVDVAAGTLDPLDEFGRFNAGRDEGIAAVLNAADIVAVVARSDAEGLHRLMYSLEWFHAHISGPKLRIVANLVSEERAGARPAQAIAQALAPYLPGEDISLIADDSQILAAQLQGSALMTAAPSSPAAQAFTELARSVMRLALRPEDGMRRTRANSAHGRHRRIRSPRMLSLAQSMRKRRKAQTREGS